MAVLVVDDLATWVLILESPFSKRLFPCLIAVYKAVSSTNSPQFLRGSPFSDDMPRPVTSETPVPLVLPSLPGGCSHGEREESWRQEAQRTRDHCKHLPGRHRAFDTRH